MSEFSQYELPFVSEVRANPADDTPRLIFADYLEEAGDPRGELIRVQVELASLPAVDPQRDLLQQREAEILNHHAEQWLAPLRQMGAIGVGQRCIQKGLIERIKINTGDWLQHKDELCRISPALHCVELKGVEKFRNELMIADFPDQITTLDLGSSGLTAESLTAWRRANWTEQIKELYLQFNRIGDSGLAGLCSGEYPRLRCLSLGLTQLTTEAATILRDWKSLASVEKLLLNVNRLGDEGVGRLASNPHLGELRELDLSSNQFGDPGALRLAEAISFGKLEHLCLRGNQVANAGLEALRESTHLPSLRSLDLRNNAITPGSGKHHYGTGSEEVQVYFEFDR